jgi:hypothetical protein
VQQLSRPFQPQEQDEIGKRRLFFLEQLADITRRNALAHSDHVEGERRLAKMFAYIDLDRP